MIDEARTPLIISGPSARSRQMYDELKEDVRHLVRHQRDFCNRLATDARKVLEKLGMCRRRHLPKEVCVKNEEDEEKEALRKLWLVSKGTPHNKILKRIKENPDLRAEIDKWDIYYLRRTKQRRACQGPFRTLYHRR